MEKSGEPTTQPTSEKSDKLATFFENFAKKHYTAVACNATVEKEDWLLDTAANNHMINKVGKRRAIEGTERKTNLLVDTANGSVEINESVSAELPIVGRLQDCLKNNESPNLISPIRR